MANEDGTGVGADATDDAAPDGGELAARLADVVFEWRPALVSDPAPNTGARWMSGRAHAALDTTARDTSCNPAR